MVPCLHQPNGTTGQSEHALGAEEGTPNTRSLLSVPLVDRSIRALSKLPRPSGMKRIYHGSLAALPKIQQGIVRGSRGYIHLVASITPSEASQGIRHGSTIIFKFLKQVLEQGHQVYCLLLVLFPYVWPHMHELIFVESISNDFHTPKLSLEGPDIGVSLLLNKIHADGFGPCWQIGDSSQRRRIHQCE